MIGERSAVGGAAPISPAAVSLSKTRSSESVKKLYKCELSRIFFHKNKL